MQGLGSADWLEIFERFRDLKKVEKHCPREWLLLYDGKGKYDISNIFNLPQASEEEI